MPISRGRIRCSCRSTPFRVRAKIEVVQSTPLVLVYAKCRRRLTPILLGSGQTAFSIAIRFSPDLLFLGAILSVLRFRLRCLFLQCLSIAALKRRALSNPHPESASSFLLECSVLARPRPDPIVYPCLSHTLIPHFFIDRFVSPQFFSPD
jgi:hypothetical protein